MPCLECNLMSSSYGEMVGLFLFGYICYAGLLLMLFRYGIGDIEFSHFWIAWLITGGGLWAGNIDGGPRWISWWVIRGIEVWLYNMICFARKDGGMKIGSLAVGTGLIDFGYCIIVLAGWFAVCLLILEFSVGWFVVLFVW